MHPMLMLTSSAEGVAYINGEFLGEVRPGAPILRPARAFGAVYLQFMPLKSGYLPLARRFAMRAGVPVAESFEGEDGLNAIAWPFGITEIEIEPEEICVQPPNTRALTGAGRAFRVTRLGKRARLEIEAAGRVHAYALPLGAREPAFAEGDKALYISGDTDSGEKYVLALSEDAGALLFQARGRDIAFLGGGRIQVVQDVGDLAGHARATVWARGEGGFLPELFEILPNPEGEYRPLTPIDCAIAAMQAAQLGLMEEAEACFLPGARMDEACARLAEDSSGVARLRFSPPDGRSAIGALRAINDRFAEAIPVYYACEMAGGAWKLKEMAL